MKTWEVIPCNSFLLVVCVCVCYICIVVCVCVCYIFIVSMEVRRVSDPLELELLQAVVGCPVWVLRVELRSPGRAAATLNP